MKKFLILTVAAAIMLALAACGTTKDENQTDIPENDGKEPTAVSNTLEGYVGEGTSMNTLQLDTEDGTYMFSTEDADIQSGDSGLFEGDKVKVTYEGELNTDGGTLKALSVELLPC